MPRARKSDCARMSAILQDLIDGQSDLLLPAILLAVGFGWTILSAAWMARRWLIGRPAPVDLFGGLLKAPRRFLVDVHNIVERDRYAARMHMFVAGGFVVTLLAIPLALLAGWAAYFQLAAAGIMLLGTAMVVARRLGKRSRPLSNGAYNLLPAGFFAFAGFYAVAALAAIGWISPFRWASVLGMALLAAGGFGIYLVVIGLTHGPMRHALAGMLHLAFHPRPERFTPGAKPAAELKMLDLGSEQLGAGRIEDFGWNMLLAFDACVQCGRCEAACPAFAAGQPLNPKKLIFDLAAAGSRSGGGVAYCGNDHPGLEGRTVLPDFALSADDFSLVGDAGVIAPATLWACTTCRACVDECPMMIEHVDAIVELRRFQTLEQGAAPERAGDMLEELRATDNLGGRDPNTRLNWAADLSLPLIAERGAADVLLWLGEGAFDLRGQRTLRALVKLLRVAGVDFAVLGNDEIDCGDLARRLGDEASFQHLAARNIELLSRYRFDTILTVDPHVLHAIGNEYPALGVSLRVVHHTVYLAQLVADGRLQFAKTGARTATLHDPCYLSRYNGEVDAPRALLEAVGVELLEMERSGRRTFCCGWGGGASIADIPGRKRIPDLRMDQARATGAELVVVACPNCAVMLEGGVEPGPAIVDIAEIMLERLAPAKAAICAPSSMEPHP